MAKQRGASSAIGDDQAEDVADALITVSRALVGIAVRSINAAPIEVTLVQHRLLVLLATGGDQTVGALAQQLEINASTPVGCATASKSSGWSRGIDHRATAGPSMCP